MRNNLQKQCYIDEYYRSISFIKLLDISKMQLKKNTQKMLHRVFFGEIKLAQDNAQRICWSMKQTFENRSGRSVQMSLSC